MNIFSFWGGTDEHKFQVPHLGGGLYWGRVSKCTTSTENPATREGLRECSWHRNVFKDGGRPKWVPWHVCCCFGVPSNVASGGLLQTEQRFYLPASSQAMPPLYGGSSQFSCTKRWQFWRGKISSKHNVVLFEIVKLLLEGFSHQVWAENHTAGVF